MIKYLKYSLLFFALPFLAESISIDGNLNEPEWQTAAVIDNYYEVSPYTLKKSEYKTTALIFSNEDGIYVSFKNYQKKSSMMTNKSMRDQTPETSDQNGIAIDFDGNRSKAYMFQVTLADVQADGIRALGGSPKYDWDGDWEVKTKKYDDFWISEYYIPWNVVLMKNFSSDFRTINVTTFRYIANDQIWINSSKTNGFRTDFLSSMDTFEVRNFTKSKLNFFPYVSKTYNSVSNFDENKVGAEVFYNTGTGKQVNLTVNPDFGQAESDEVVINFSAQETFYSEKRAFFNENQSLFNINHYDRYSVINTRRIGSASQYDCSNASNENSCNNAKKNYSDIDFALRYTQKNNDTETGFFVAQETDEAYSKGRDYYAVRSKTTVGNKTYGYMLTHVVNNFLDETATVNVFDFSNVKSKKLTLYTDILSSEKNNNSGLGLRSQFVYKPTKNSRRSGSIVYFEDDFKLNDFGYLKRSDWFHVGVGTDITKTDFNESSIFEQIDFGIDFNYDSDTSGNSNPLNIWQKNEMRFKDRSRFELMFGLKSSGKNTTITRKNDLYPFVKVKNNISITGDFEAQNFNFWTYDWRVSFDKGDKYDTWDSKGYSKRFFKVAGKIFPNDNLTIKTEIRIKKEKEWLNWIDQNNLATFDLKQKIISIDLNWYNSSKHEIRLKSQFIALEAENPRSLVSNYAGYLSQGSSEVKPFTNGVASFQVRYKYEIAPLSYLYVVYSKGGSVYDEDDDKNTSQIFKDPWEEASDEVLSIKLRLKY
jgi:hypothetical protein|tara:strand:+ start:5098 stop:7380 length:2283 start_codon:yes stop_codon:yes gene_type:complete